jgi:redox-sensitive bicupin YhaK (pirin superfamily)
MLELGSTQVLQEMLLALRTGRGAWHAEAVGADEVEEDHGDKEFRSVLFWVNLARKDKTSNRARRWYSPEQIATREEGDAIVRVLVGDGAFGANLRTARPPQLVLLGAGERFTVTDAVPGTRYILMAGKP